MKKNLFFLAVAAVALASCSNDEVVSQNTASSDNQQKEIAFAPLSQPITRAYANVNEYNAIEGVGYPKNYDMKVVAYMVPKSASYGVAGNYFGSATADGGVLFKYNYAGGTGSGTNNYWGGNPAQYWPLTDAALNFLAVTYNGSPTSNTVSPQFNADYASGVAVTLSDNAPATATAGLGQHDLMYAYGQGKVTQDGNALTVPSKVDMTFNHALAWVYFRVKAGNTPAQNIAINSITLKDAYYSGVFTAGVTGYDDYTTGPSAWTFASTDKAWTSNGSQGDYASPNMTYTVDLNDDSTNDAQGLTASFVNVGDGLLVIPTANVSTTPVSFSEFVIAYTYNGRQFYYTYTPTAADKTLSMGKKYIFDITMTLSEIFVNPTVVDWDASENEGEFVDIPAYAIGTDWNYGSISKAAATYKFSISGKTGTLSVDDSSSLTDFAETPTVSGNVVTFKVNANTTGADRTYQIDVTDDMGTAGDTSDDVTSTITFTQAGS